MEYQQARRIVVDYLRQAGPEYLDGLCASPGILDDPTDEDLIILSGSYITFWRDQAIDTDKPCAQYEQLLIQFVENKGICTNRSSCLNAAVTIICDELYAFSRYDILIKPHEMTIEQVIIQLARIFKYATGRDI